MLIVHHVLCCNIYTFYLLNNVTGEKNAFPLNKVLGGKKMKSEQKGLPHPKIGRRLLSLTD